MQTSQLHTTLSTKHVGHVVLGLSYLSWLESGKEGYDIKKDGGV